MRRIDVKTEIIIARPCRVVSAYAADPDNATEWYVNIKSVDWRTPRPLRVGTRVAFSAKFLGRRLEYVYEITEFVPGRKLVMRIAQGPFPMETTYEWQDAGPSSTRMLLRNTGCPSGFSRWLAPVMTAAMRMANRKDLKLLKSRLEGEND